MCHSRFFALFLVLAGLAPGVAAQSNNAENKSEKRVIAQIRFLGLERVKEENVRNRIKAREWAPYSAEDKALDIASLLATGEFASVKASEVFLSSAAIRLDFEVVEASLPAEVSTTTSVALPPPEPSVSTAAVSISTRAAFPPVPEFTPGTWGVKPKASGTGELEPPWVIGDIASDGNKHVKFSTLRSQIKARKGDLYQKSDLESDIQALLRMGNFDRVWADVSPTGKPVPAHLQESSGSTTTIKLTIHVEERPLIKKIKFEGYKKVGRGKLLDTITVKEKDPLDRSKIKEDTQKILEVYREKGYLAATADSRIEIDTTTANANVFFTIVEGPRSLVDVVDIQGATVYKVKKLRKKMANRRKKVFQEAKLKEDIEAIETRYKNNGYLEVEISSPVVVFSDDRTKVNISFTIKEGVQSRFGRTTFTGYEVYRSSELVKTIDYRRGKIFNKEKFDTTIRNIQELYAEKGRLRARVTPDRTYNPETKETDVNFDIIEGGVVYVDHVDVEGNVATKNYVLKREVVMKPGEPFSASKLRKSQERIMNLGFIDDIQMDIQSPVDPDKVDVTFEVVEGKPGMLTAGAGFSSLDGLLGTLSLQHLNLFGRAQRASVQWQFGARVQDYSISWTTPWTAGRPISLGFDVFNTRRLRPFESSNSAFVDKRRGGTMRLGPRFRDDKYQINFNYTFQQISVTNIQTQFIDRLVEGTENHSSIGLELARDTRDSIWDPTRGNRNAVGFGLAGGPLQGDIDFFKPFISNGIHFTLAEAGDWPLVLSFNNRAAYVTRFGSTRVVPVYERFFIGGQDSLRGYSPSGEVGYRDGGKVYDVFNVELGFPMARERKKTIVKLVGFFDAGGSWDNMRSVHNKIGTGERDIKTNVGVGIRFVTPAFPIRLDWGYGLQHRPGERLYQINFGLGPLF